MNSPSGIPYPFEETLIIAIDCELFSKDDKYQERSNHKDRIKNKINKHNNKVATDNE